MSLTRERRPAWLTWGLAALGYLVMAALATFPVVTRFGSEVPGELTDPLEHLWLMRWLRSCWVEGRNPLFCPEIQAPVGVPLGYFPTLHLQTVLYILLRLVTDNDTAIFGTIWFVGFVATGLASFGLVRWALDGCPSGVAWVAGLGMMLCGPMLMHAHGHLETMQMGVVPPFLIAWIGFVDQPSRRRLTGAVLLYLVVAAAAPYFAVLAIFPTAWYLGWMVLTADREQRWPRVRRLVPWMIGFGVVALPGLALLFGGQVWAAWQGFPMTRSRREFDLMGAPVWSSFMPSPRHLLGRVLPFNLFEGAGLTGRLPEVSSYLGIMALGLLTVAAGKRVQFPRRGYWWSVLALMVVLSWGSRQEVFGATVSLPAGWLHGIFPPFHLIRVPARFNLFAAAVAVVPVAAGLRAILARWRHPLIRLPVLATVAGVTLADLAMVPFPTAPIPEPPSFYADIKRSNPAATILEAPVFDSTRGQTFSSLWGYWQQIHGLRTSGGYPGLANTRFDAEIARPSVFAADRLRADAPVTRFGIDGELDPLDRLWLELTAHGFDQVVLHLNHGLRTGNPPWFDRLPASFRRYAPGSVEGMLEAMYRSDFPEAVVLARDQLESPRALTWMADQGWRQVPLPPGQLARRYAALPSAGIEVYRPTAGAVVVTLGAVEAFGHPRVVRLVEGDRELARWTTEPGTRRDLRSPPVELTPGRHSWTLRSDGADRPTRNADRLDDAATAYSFRLSGVRVAAVASDPVKTKD